MTTSAPRNLTSVLALTLLAPFASADKGSGTFKYLDSGGIVKPIANAKVEIWRFAPPQSGGVFIWGWSLVDTAWTSEQGSISRDIRAALDWGISPDGRLPLPIKVPAEGVVYAVRVFATNYAAQVWPNDALHLSPFYREPGPAGTPLQRNVYSYANQVDFTWTFSDSFRVQHFNIAETARAAHDYATQHRSPGQTEPIPPANIQPTSAAKTSWYNAPANTIVIHSNHVPPRLPLQQPVTWR